MSEAYRIYYENEEELSTKEPGVEIPLQKDIVWENKNSQCEQWKALSVFVFPHGLVLELAKQVTPEQYLAFYEKWKDVDEEQITERQREQIEAESPLGECPTVLLTCNGKELESDWTRGMGWYPSEILEKLDERITPACAGKRSGPSPAAVPAGPAGSCPASRPSQFPPRMTVIRPRP